MKWNATGMVLSAAILVTLPADVRAETTEPRLVVRTYNNHKIPERVLDAARKRAGALLAGAGVEVTWVDCWFGNRAATDAARCQEPIASNEVMLRLQASALPRGVHTLLMGYSLVHLESGAPFLATVYADRVASVARSTETQYATLLGLVIVHEIGHLLLDRDEHSSQGLMRAQWSRGELKGQTTARDWEFQADEVAAIQAAAERRNMRAAWLFAMD